MVMTVGYYDAKSTLNHIHSEGHTPQLVDMHRQSPWKLLRCLFHFFAYFQVDSQGHTYCHFITFLRPTKNNNVGCNGG